MSAKKAKKASKPAVEVTETTQVKKSKTGTIIIILLVMIIMIGGVGGYFYIQNMKSSAPQQKQIKQAMVPLNEMVVNLADEGGKRYVKANPSIGYNSENKRLTEELTNNAPVLRDVTISTLRSKQSKELDTKGIEALKKEIMENINSTLNEGRITNIYFTDFVIQ